MVDPVDVDLSLFGYPPGRASIIQCPGQDLKVWRAPGFARLFRFHVVQTAPKWVQGEDARRSLEPARLVSFRPFPAAVFLKATVGHIFGRGPDVAGTARWVDAAGDQERAKQACRRLASEIRTLLLMRAMEAHGKAAVSAKGEG